MCGVPDDPDYTNELLANNGICGLKMYYYYKDKPVTSIFDFFKPSILSVAEMLKKPIILHLPVEIDKDMREVLKICQTWPKLNIVLAHMGRPSNTKGLKNVYSQFLDYPRVYFDTAMVTSTEVISSALSVLGSKRLLFGSDLPLSLVRAVMYYDVNLGKRYITKYPYHWVDKQEHKQHGHLVSKAVHAHWGILHAIRESVEKCNSGDWAEIKNNIFYRNAQCVFLEKRKNR